jgi:hypothetical protein
MHVLQARRRKWDKPENEENIYLMLRCEKREKIQNVKKNRKFKPKKIKVCIHSRNLGKQETYQKWYNVISNH